MPEFNFSFLEDLYGFNPAVQGNYAGPTPTVTNSGRTANGNLNPQANFWDGNNMVIPYFQEQPQVPSPSTPPPTPTPPAPTPNPTPPAPTPGPYPSIPGTPGFPNYPGVPSYPGGGAPSFPDAPGYQPGLSGRGFQVSESDLAQLRDGLGLSGLADRMDQLQQQYTQTVADRPPLGTPPEWAAGLNEQLSDLNSRVGQLDTGLSNRLTADQVRQITGGALDDRLGGITSQLDALQGKVDNPPVMDRLSDFEGQITRLTDMVNMGMEPRQAPVDLSGINARLDALAARPEPAPAPAFDYDRISQMMDQRFAALPQPAQVDLSGLQDQIGQLSSQMNQGFSAQPQPAPAPSFDYDRLGSMLDQRFSAQPQPAQVDLSGLEGQIGQLSSQLQQGFSAIPQPAQVDLSGINSRLDQLASRELPSFDYDRIGAMMNQAVGGIDIPQPAQVDLSGIQQQIAGLGSQMQQGFSSIPQPAAAPSIDYGRIQAGFDQAIGGIPQAAPVDLSGINSQLASLSSQIGQGFSTMPAAPDYSTQLAALQQQLAALSAPTAPTNTVGGFTGL